MSTSTSLADGFERLRDEIELDHTRTPVALVNAATALLPACAWAAVVRVDGRNRAHVLAVDDEVAVEAVGFETATGEGPALDAARGSRPVHTVDLTTEHRWPLMRAGAVPHTPVRAVVAGRLNDERHPLVLLLYADRPHAFAGEAGLDAQALLSHARATVRFAQSLDKIDNLASALATSRTIGTAIGVLAVTHDLTTEAAFDLLRATSNAMEVKVRVLAEEIVRTREIPSVVGPAPEPDVPVPPARVGEVTPPGMT